MVGFSPTLLFTLLLVCLLGQGHCYSIQKPVQEENEKKMLLYVNEAGDYSVSTSFSSTDESIATGSYLINVNNSGFNYLEISTTSTPSFFTSSSDLDDYLMHMKGAGFLEGYLTCKEISIFYPNFYSDTFGEDDVPQQVKDFVEDNYDWVKAQANSAENADSEYWQTVRGTISQLTGLVEGFAASSCGQAGESFTLLQALYMNAWGDLYTIQTKYALEKSSSSFLEARRRGERRTRVGYPRSPYLPKDLRCSSMWKVLPDFSDILFSHVTWDGFEALGPRIFKQYTLPVSNSTLHRTVYFSSSPACLSSVDDFYLSLSEEDESVQLAVIETTNELYNPDKFDLVVPQSVLSWMRVIVANTVSTTGPSWADAFGTHASGTYTNQWMVLDMNLFEPGNSMPKANLFTVLEEIPGDVMYQDMSQSLYKSTYWASYNIPFFDEIYIESGNKAACDAGSVSGNYGNCYDSCPRANIFRSRYDSVLSLSDMQNMINYNDWQTDPNSLGDPCNAIACRRDLEPSESSRYPAGGLDGKVLSVMSSIKQNNPQGPVIMARVGPTNDDQPPFCWSNVENESEFSHTGQPDCFQYQWASVVFSEQI